MNITAEQAQAWADNHRSNLIREIDYLIEDLSKAKMSDHVGGNPEIRLMQIMKEQYQAETLERLAQHIRLNDNKVEA